MDLFYLANYSGQRYIFIAGPYSSWNHAWSNRFKFLDEYGSVDVVTAHHTVRR